MQKPPTCKAGHAHYAQPCSDAYQRVRCMLLYPLIAFYRQSSTNVSLLRKYRNFRAIYTHFRYFSLDTLLIKIFLMLHWAAITISAWPQALTHVYYMWVYGISRRLNQIFCSIATDTPKPPGDAPSTQVRISDDEWAQWYISAQKTSAIQNRAVSNWNVRQVHIY